MDRRRFRIIFMPVCVALIAMLSASVALADLDQDDVVLDPTKGKHRLHVTDEQEREGFGDAGVLRDDLLDETFYMCIKGDDGSERIVSLFIVTDRWYTSPRVIQLHEEDDYVRFYLNGERIDKSCNHIPDQEDSCKNTGIPAELDGELESKEIHWITEDGERGSGADRKVYLLHLAEGDTEKPCP